MRLVVETFPYGADLWDRIEPTWTELLTRTAETSAFLSVTWMAAWMETFGPELRPLGLVWRDGSGLPVACALLSAQSDRLGPFPITRNYLNASGADSWCEHNDVLVVPRFRSSVLDGLVRIIRDGGADELALVGMREKTATALRARWPSQSSTGHLSESPYVALESLRAEGTPFLSSLSSNTRSQIRRSVRLYEERWGGQSVEVATAHGQAKEWFADMIALHEERWRKRGQQGAFADERTRSFHARLLERRVGRQAKNRLGIDIMRIQFGDETIALLYLLTYSNRVNFYQSGLLYHDDNRLKPGLVAHALAIEYYLERGEIEYDFLGGWQEAARYKLSLSTNVRSLAWIQLQAPNVKMRVLEGLRRAKSIIRPDP